MAEKKIMCGGFLVGDGLDIDGKTLYATGGGGGAKFYTYNDDYTAIKGAGKDIQNIMANGGFTVCDPGEDYDSYEWLTFGSNGIRSADGKIVYWFSNYGSEEPDEFEIVGDDLYRVEP